MTKRKVQFQAGDECFLKGSLERVVVEAYLTNESRDYTVAEVRRSDGKVIKVPVTTLTDQKAVTDAVRYHQNVGLRHPRVWQDSLPF